MMTKSTSCFTNRPSNVSRSVIEPFTRCLQGLDECEGIAMKTDSFGWRTTQAGFQQVHVAAVGGGGVGPAVFYCRGSGLRAIVGATLFHSVGFSVWAMRFCS